ncbi:MAG: hypothetical protein H6717_25955 [Polyangiaceae bacterium]|nr:hypothetical protein [Polyangiaceae bacterium]
MMAWGPALVTFVTGALAYMAAVVGMDGVAARLHSAAVILAFASSVLLWLGRRYWAMLLAAPAAKLAAFFWFAPRGLASLAMSYADVRSDAPFREWLDYFWWLPAVLFVIALTEGWVGGPTPLRQTRAWRYRWVLGPLVGVALLFGVGYHLFAADYYLWKLEGGRPSAAYSLMRLGPRVLPRLYREIEDKPGFRPELAGVITEARRRVVAKKIHSDLYEDVEAARVGADEVMARTLAHALASETDVARGRETVRALGYLDFDTKLAVFCRGFDAAKPEIQVAMIDLATELGRRAKKDTPEALACAVPRVRSTVIRELPRWTRAPVWGMDAIDLLARTTPLPGGDRDKLAHAAKDVRDGYLLVQLIDRLGLLGKAPTAALAEVFRSNPYPDARASLLHWAKGHQKHVDYPAFACKAFPLASASERQTLLYELPKNACVTGAVMNALEETLLGSKTGVPLWTFQAHNYLIKAEDDRVAPWAKALAERIAAERTFYLRDLY